MTNSMPLHQNTTEMHLVNIIQNPATWPYLAKTWVFFSVYMAWRIEARPRFVWASEANLRHISKFLHDLKMGVAQKLWAQYLQTCKLLLNINQLQSLFTGINCIMLTYYLPLIHVMFGIIKPHSDLHCIPFSTPMKNVLHRCFSQIPKIPIIQPWVCVFTK